MKRLLPIAVSASLLLVGGCALPSQVQAHAEEQMAEWTVGTKYTPRTCRSSDTDQNGYVSCEVLDDKGTILQIECAAPFTFNEGCKLSALRQQ